MQKTIGLTILAMVFLLGCAAVAHQDQSLEPAVRDYMERLRWKDWNGAARYLPEKERDPFLQRMLAEEDLHMTDVRLEGVETQDGTRAVTRMVLEYYLLPSATVKTVRVKQEWSYTQGDKNRPAGWQVLTPPPPLQ